MLFMFFFLLILIITTIGNLDKKIIDLNEVNKL